MKELHTLMVKAFSRREMAMHSLTGATCNVNAGKEARSQINRDKMDEIFSKLLHFGNNFYHDSF